MAYEARMRITQGAWVVVCDGNKALILENSGSPAAVKLDTRETREHTGTPTHEQGTDHPGRVTQSFGEARSAVEQTDWHDRAEREFLESVARRLDAAIAAGETRDLVIIAPPRALGMLREAYSPTVRTALRGEINKDYIKMPIRDIEAHLAG